ncbi:MAG: GNAT family N-acetyltransferase [Planctomycetes bacterium]|nr:GNAT family N-acetyltransferase [Planctomycetota bacterium]
MDHPNVGPTWKSFRPPAATEAARASPLVYRTTTPRDRWKLVRMFRETFQVDDDRFEPTTPRRWAWKYFDRPGLNHSVLADEPDGEVVAHIGGLAFRMRCGERLRLSVNATDHMVHPHRRGQGIFVQTMRAWLERYLDDQRDFLGWGFPSRRAFQLGHDFLGYAAIRPMVVLVSTSDVGPHSQDPSFLVEEPRDVPGDVTTLWHAMRTPIAVERDVPHLTWRYVRHPRPHYRMFALRERSTHRLRAFAVTAPCPFTADLTSILEWMVRPDDQEAAQLLLAELARSVQPGPRRALAVWVPESTSYHTWFVARGFRPNDTGIVLTARCWDPRITNADLRDAFYLTLGDFDNV